MLDKNNLPIVGQTKAFPVPPHVFETPDNKTWAAQQSVTLGFVDTDGNFVTVNQVMGTVVDEICKRLPEIIGKILSPVKANGT